MGGVRRAGGEVLRSEGRICGGAHPPLWRGGERRRGKQGGSRRGRPGPASHTPHLLGFLRSSSSRMLLSNNNDLPTYTHPERGRMGLGVNPPLHTPPTLTRVGDEIQSRESRLPPAGHKHQHWLDGAVHLRGGGVGGDKGGEREDEGGEREGWR